MKGKHQTIWTRFERITSAAVRNRQRQPKRWNTAALISSQIRCGGTRTRRGSTARAGLLLPAPRNSETSLGEKRVTIPASMKEVVQEVTAIAPDELWIKNRVASAVLREYRESSEDFQTNVKYCEVNNRKTRMKPGLS